MELSDKIRRVAFTVAVGSIGAVIGYVGNDVVEVIREVRKEAVAKEEANREYMRRIKDQYQPPTSNYRQPEPNVSFYCPGPGISCAF